MSFDTYIPIIFNGHHFEANEDMLKNSSPVLSNLISKSKSYNFSNLTLNESMFSFQAFEVFLNFIHQKSFSISCKLYYDLKALSNTYQINSFFPYLKMFRASIEKIELSPYKLLYQISHNIFPSKTIKFLTQNLNIGLKKKVFDIIPIPHLEEILSNSEEPIDQKEFLEFLRRLSFKGVDVSPLLKFVSEPSEISSQIPNNSLNIRTRINQNDSLIKSLTQKVESDLASEAMKLSDIMKKYESKTFKLENKVPTILAQTNQAISEIKQHQFAFSEISNIQENLSLQNAALSELQIQAAEIKALLDKTKQDMSKPPSLTSK